MFTNIDFRAINVVICAKSLGEGVTSVDALLGTIINLVLRLISLLPL